MNSSDLYGTIQTDAIQKEDAASSPENYRGCTDGKALSTSRIQVNFEFPATAEKVTLYRDGESIFSSTDHSAVSWTDTGRQEGVWYHYTCEAVYSGKAYSGPNTLRLQTLSFNAPTFSGIQAGSADPADPASSIRVSWYPASATGIPADSYQIYASAGPTIDWNSAPKITIEAGTFSTSVSGLGSELTYTLGVRACSSVNVCDTNTKTLSIDLSTPKAPTTVGATSASMSNGTLNIIAPWSDSRGGLGKRHVFYKASADPTGANPVFPVSDPYVEFSPSLVTDPYAPPTTLEIPKGNLTANTWYFLTVQDEDRLATPDRLLNPATVDPASYQVRVWTGDIVPPSYDGKNISIALNPADLEHQIDITFTAVAREDCASFNDVGCANGVSHYLVYLAYGSPFPYDPPANACLSGELFTEIPAAAFAPGAGKTATITVPNARTTYSVCLKVRDSSGNISSGYALPVSSYKITTLDTHAPAFSGIQNYAYVNADQTLSVSWYRSSSSDRKTYRVKFWKLIAGSPAMEKEFTFNDTSLSWDGAGGAIQSFRKTLPENFYPFSDGDTVYSQVNACDDADSLPLYGGGTYAAQCTTSTTIKNIFVPDSTPPSGFTGITQVSAPIGDGSNGRAILNWILPGDLADFAGFYVYVAAAADPINTNSVYKDCFCGASGCAASFTSCTIDGLQPHRTYKFHVRPYDAAGNVAYLDSTIVDTAGPGAPTPTRTGLTSDNLKPTFVSNLLLDAQNRKTSFTSGSDNQVEGQITYEVYRSDNVNITVFPPAVGGSITKSDVPAGQNFWNDPAPYSDGRTYYYTMCAVDASANRACDQNVISYLTGDATPPNIYEVTSDKIPDDTADKKKKWKLGWKMNDNSGGQLLVDIYQNISDAKTDATTADPHVYSDVVAATSYDTAYNTPSIFQGQINSAKWVNLLLVVRDLSLNMSQQKVSFYVDNRMSITLFESGATAYIEGTGLSKGTENGFGIDTKVFLADIECTGVTIEGADSLTCNRADISVYGNMGTIGAVTIQNPDGSSASLAAGFTLTTSDPCAYSANLALPFAAGTGTSFDPYIVCNKAQLENLTSGYAKLGSFIKVGSTYSPRAFSGNLDGSGHSIGLWSGAGCGLFNGLTGAVSNLNLKKISISCTGTTLSAGTLANYITGATTLTSIKLKTISVQGQSTLSSSGTAGLIGSSEAQALNLSAVQAQNVTVFSSGVNVGGLIGHIKPHLTAASSVDRSYVQGGSITGSSYVGGIIGHTTNNNTGEFSLTRSFNTASVTATYEHAGGLIGQFWLNGKIENNYSTGAVTADSVSGGLVGLIVKGNLPLQFNYATGLVAAGTNPNTTHALYGFNGAGGALTTGSHFWMGDGNLQTDIGSGSVMKSAAEMQDQVLDIYFAAGWSISADPLDNTTWFWPPAGGYPILRGVTP